MTVYQPQHSQTININGTFTVFSQLPTIQQILYKEQTQTSESTEN